MAIRVLYLGSVLAVFVAHVAQAQSGVFRDEGSSQLQVDAVFSSSHASSYDDVSPLQYTETCCTLTECKSGGCNSICMSPTLTGDWCGLRSHLRESGVNFRGTVTQFGFGVDGGINQPVPAPLGQGNTFKYTGRGEYDLIFDLNKLAGLQGGKFLVGAQHWWGEYGNVSLNTGSVTPPIFPAFLPTSGDNSGQMFLTDFLWSQALSEQLIVFAGKKNVIGTADQNVFAGGDGTDQFMNQALVANPAFLLALPYSAYTAGVVIPQSWGVFTAYIWDPTDRTTQGLNMNGLFDEGIIVGTQVKVNTNFFNRPGEHHVGGLWKNLELLDLSAGIPPIPEYPYPPGPPGSPTISDSYTLYYGFDQYIQVFPGERRSPAARKPPRGWGVFGRASISDGNPTPFRYFLSAGIGGDSRLGCDRGDTFGLGWFYNGVSQEFGPTAQALLGPRDGTGVELYYNLQLTPWLNVTPDLQYVRPGIGAFTSGDDAFIYGLRVNVRL